jgi:catechol 2,3-dioxygenase-like lactoylglutathione lyase family enzyme
MSNDAPLQADRAALSRIGCRPRPAAGRPRRRRPTAPPQADRGEVFGQARGARGTSCQDRTVEVLSSRILLRPGNLERSQHFYRDVLGLAVYREFGPADKPGVVFFLGSGSLEVSGGGFSTAGQSSMLWLQVRDVRAEHERLSAAGVRVLREPRTEPWGLIEMWLEDPDGVPIVLVEIPADHPLRRDQRP